MSALHSSTLALATAVLLLACGKTAEDATPPEDSTGACQADTFRACNTGVCVGIERCEDGAWGDCRCSPEGGSSGGAGSGGVGGSGSAAAGGATAGAGGDAGAGGASPEAGGASAGGQTGAGGVSEAGAPDAPIAPGPCGVPWSGFSDECWSCLCNTCPAELAACTIPQCNGEQITCGVHHWCHHPDNGGGAVALCYREHCQPYQPGYGAPFAALDACLSPGAGWACDVECDFFVQPAQGAR
jgi:hypothetical protein